jgi:lambda repressor-like predicted transcriptional regulator
MTPSQKAKSAGLSSLAEVSKMTGVSTQTLNNWFNEKPKLFEIVIAGCAAVKSEKAVA